MDIKHYYKLIDKDTIAPKTEIAALQQLVDAYPYFQSAIFLYLKTLYVHSDGEYEKELARLSIFINDRKALFYYILSEEYAYFFEQTNKQSLADDKTQVLLNAFFSLRESDDSLLLEHETVGNGLISSDYFTFVEHQPSEKNEESANQDVPLKHQGIIDTFIQKSKDDDIHVHLVKDQNQSLAEIEPNVEDEDASDELNDDLFFTETLAKIYIKQKKYEKAYKIIQHLSLNFPKKNAYFADQLSFIEKLIINTKYKDKK